LPVKANAAHRAEVVHVDARRSQAFDERDAFSALFHLLVVSVYDGLSIRRRR